MTDRDQLYTGLSQAAWGYFFLTFDFNLNNVSILPRFVGFYLLFSAIGKLSGERRDLNLLRPLCVLLTGWSGMDWLLSWVGVNVEGHILFLDLLVTAVALYFHFQFLTDMAALAERHKHEESDLERRLLKQRTVYVVLMTAIDLLGNLPWILAWEWRFLIAGALALAVCLDALFIMNDLFHLRKRVHTAEPPPHL